MFACPILRQQSSDCNPPMRLICGHIISKDAVHKLGTATNKYRFYLTQIICVFIFFFFLCFRLKCPYCPIEQSSSEAKHICF